MSVNHLGLFWARLVSHGDSSLQRSCRQVNFQCLLRVVFPGYEKWIRQDIISVKPAWLKYSFPEIWILLNSLQCSFCWYSKRLTQAGQLRGIPFLACFLMSSWHFLLSFTIPVSNRIYLLIQTLHSHRDKSVWGQVLCFYNFSRRADSTTKVSFLVLRFLQLIQSGFLQSGPKRFLSS